MKTSFNYLTSLILFSMFVNISCSNEKGIIGKEYTYIEEEKMRAVTLKFYENGDALMVSYTVDAIPVDDNYSDFKYTPNYYYGKYITFIDRNTDLKYKKEEDGFILQEDDIDIAKCTFSHRNKDLEIVFFEDNDTLHLSQSHYFPNPNGKNELARKYYSLKDEEHYVFIDDTLLAKWKNGGNCKILPYDLNGKNVYIDGMKFELEDGRLNLNSGWGFYSFELKEKDLTELRIRELLLKGHGLIVDEEAIRTKNFLKWF